MKPRITRVMDSDRWPLNRLAECTEHWHGCAHELFVLSQDSSWTQSHVINILSCAIIWITGHPSRRRGQEGECGDIAPRAGPYDSRRPEHDQRRRVSGHPQAPCNRAKELGAQTRGDCAEGLGHAGRDGVVELRHDESLPLRYYGWRARGPDIPHR